MGCLSPRPLAFGPGGPKQQTWGRLRSMELKRFAFPWLVLFLPACDKPQSDAPQAVTAAPVTKPPPVARAPPLPLPPPSAVKTLKKKNASHFKCHPAPHHVCNCPALEL